MFDQRTEVGSSPEPSSYANLVTVNALALLSLKRVQFYTWSKWDPVPYPWRVLK
jgi:hypothetical protein